MGLILPYSDICGGGTQSVKFCELMTLYQRRHSSLWLESPTRLWFLEHEWNPHSKPQGKNSKMFL